MTLGQLNRVSPLGDRFKPESLLELDEDDDSEGLGDKHLQRFAVPKVLLPLPPVPETIPNKKIKRNISVPPPKQQQW